MEFQYLWLFSVFIFREGLQHEGHHGVEDSEEETGWLSPDNPLLLVSFDGFRWDYLKRLKNRTTGAGGSVKNYFEEIISTGVWAEAGLMNVFSTVTFPNHYSIVTGLYEESHGVVGNSVFLPEKNRTFRMPEVNGSEAEELYKGEPIWTTFASQQSKFHVGCFMWVGCDKPISGLVLPSVVSFHPNSSCDEHLDYGIRWLRGGMKLVLLYFSEPDHAGHRFGVSSKEMDKVLLQLNECLGKLLELMKRNNLYDKTNVLIVSDHGMVNFRKVVTIPVKTNLFIVRVEHYSHLLIEPLPGKTNQTLRYLKKFKPDVRVYRKSEIPMNWHYKNSPRITEILVVGELGIRISTTVVSGSNELVAGHGYDNQKPEMHPIFMARGPSFSPGSLAPPEIHSVDLYLLMCRLLGLHPAPNNGSDIIVDKILQRRTATSTTTNTGYFATVTYSILITVGCSTGVVVFVLVFFFLHIVSYRKGRKQVQHVSMIDNGYTYKPVAVDPEFLAESDESEEEMFSIKK